MTGVPARALPLPPRRLPLPAGRTGRPGPAAAADHEWDDVDPGRRHIALAARPRRLTMMDSHFPWG